MGQAMSEEEASKMRAAELRDELLFKQPESSHMGDCPICMIPLPLDATKSSITSCCSKVICMGCCHANWTREYERRLQHTCPFCREAANITAEEYDKLTKKRIQANDPAAMCHQGIDHYIEGEYSKAFKYWSKAAALGDVEAHYKLACLYQTGEGVEKDRGEEIQHLEEAAIGGHPFARYKLGAYEWMNNRNAERAVKHWTISATQGEGASIKKLLEAFKQELISKEDLAVAFRAYKAALAATKSPQRKVAEPFYR